MSLERLGVDGNLIGSSYIERVSENIPLTNPDTSWLFIGSFIRSVDISSKDTPYYILIESTYFKSHDSDKSKEIAPQLCFPEDLGKNIPMNDLRIYEEHIFKKCLLYKQLNKILLTNRNLKYVFCNTDLIFPPNLIESHSTMSTLFLECLSALRQIVVNGNVTLVGVNFSTPFTNVLTKKKDEWRIYGNDYNFVHDLLINKEFTPSFENPYCLEFKKEGKSIHKSGYDSFFENYPLYTYYFKNSDTVFKIDYFTKKENTNEEKSEMRREISRILSSFAVLPFEGKMLPEPFSEVLEKCKGRVEHDMIEHITELHHELRGE